MPERSPDGAEVGAGDRSGKPVAHLPATATSAAGTRTITVTGARGGHGATTMAAALALFAAKHGRTTLVAHDRWAAAVLLGMPEGDEEVVEVTAGLSLARHAPTDPRDTLVVDGGAAGGESTGESYVVLRGPCYVALASLLATLDAPPDGVIVLAEPGRSLTCRDVYEVVGIPVVATVRASPSVARTIDAGLLVGRVHRLRELAPLAALVGQRDSSGSHTDLPRPLGGRGGEVPSGPAATHRWPAGGTGTSAHGAV